MKTLVKVFCLMLIALQCACAMKPLTDSQDSLYAITKSTMNRILILMDEETQNQVSEYIIFLEKGSDYKEIPLLNQEAVYLVDAQQNGIDHFIELIKEPIALSYLFSLPGSPQKLGLTECQDPFAMIGIDEDLRLRAYEIFSQEEIEDAYRNAVKNENERLQCKNR